MELRHLRYFIAVAEEENVTRASVRLHVAQPSLSRQIRDLEHELGVSLFDHGPRALRLTEAGRHFLAEAREVVASADGAVRSVRDFAHGPAGEIHIGYAPSLTTKVLPQALRRFQQSHPKTYVRLHDRSTMEMLSGLHNETLDAALLVKPSAAALDVLDYQEVFRFLPCVAMSSSHPLAAHEVLTRTLLLEYPFVAYSQDDYPEYHQWLQRIFKEKSSPHVIAEYDSSTSLIAAIESGCGVAIVQEGFDHLAGSRLLIRPLVDVREETFSFGIACRKGTRKEATRAFIAAICTEE